MIKSAEMEQAARDERIGRAARAAAAEIRRELRSGRTLQELLQEVFDQNEARTQRAVDKAAGVPRGR